MKCIFCHQYKHINSPAVLYWTCQNFAHHYKHANHAVHFICEPRADVRSLSRDFSTQVAVMESQILWVLKRLSASARLAHLRTRRKVSD